MLKTKSEFADPADYKKYTRTPEFMNNYLVYGKSAKEIQKEMVFPSNWMNFLEAAVKFIHDNPEQTRHYTAYHMFELVDEIMEYYLKG